jgi:large subunit ribosomal protein L35
VGYPYSPFATPYSPLHPLLPVVFSGRLCHKPGLSSPGSIRAAVAATLNPSARSSEHFRPDRAFGHGSNAELKESKMPKIKTKSGAKKRFKITAGGKVKSAMAGKRHGMIKRTKKQIRQHRGTRVMFKTDGDNIVKYFLPNG